MYVLVPKANKKLFDKFLRSQGLAENHYQFNKEFIFV